MGRVSEDDVRDLLRDAGVDDAAIEAIIGNLLRVGLSPPEVRAWLAHPQKAYVVRTGTMTIGGEEVDRRAVPLHAIEDGRADVVRLASEQFAAASDDERFLCSTFLCNLEDLSKLTRSDSARTQRLREIAELLLARLRKSVHVNEILQTTIRADPADETRFVDLLLRDELDEVLAQLHGGQLDPVTIHREGELHYFGW